MHAIEDFCTFIINSGFLKKTQDTGGQTGWDKSSLTVVNK